MYHYTFLPIPPLHHQHTIIRHIHTTHTTTRSPQQASITPSLTTPIQTTENLSQKTHTQHTIIHHTHTQSNTQNLI
ncbi:hypothetical protein EBI_26779 [Enterocytozoon bieneusi H348]|nr:hypothetical protein EBI_26779 [Enterocytozoon bieneusi H348]|eukprot:XP_002651888.1 hypothetical protein EBI_26779 [Enterocytozoon bieneusi H348]